jgi:methylenetetrahydrofolate dehydrogenase (NADP+)/methenyltetrahydrofolate cyclohydrolase
VTRVVDGKKLAAEIRAEVAARVEARGGPVPCLATVLVGDDPGSQVYVRHKHIDCRKVGFNSVQIELPADISQDELLGRVHELNEDPKVHGFLVQLPLPGGLDPSTVAAALAPDKDVDGLTPVNAGRLLRNDPGLRPCTPLGCLEILDRNGIELEGARAVVIGRSDIVGKPVALLLLHRSATVTVCHSRTRDLPDVVRGADVVIAAVGQPRLVQGDWIKPGAAVIDVGMNRVGDKLHGDVDFEAASQVAGLITPVPGGVGPLTRAMLLVNTLRALELQQG